MIDTGMGTPLGYVLSAVLADSACGTVSRSAGPDDVITTRWTWDGKRPVWNACPRGRAARDEVPTKAPPSACAPFGMTSNPWFCPRSEKRFN